MFLPQPFFGLLPLCRELQLIHELRRSHRRRDHGLTAAFYLQRRGLRVAVYEASSRIGGAIQSVRQDGYLAECGPNTLLETSPLIGQLLHDAGLTPRRLDPDPRAAARYVVRDRRPLAMPGSVPGFMTTPLFSLAAKFAVLKEPFVAARRDGVEESIAEFVVRRLGREFLDHTIDALVSGIYAGDPARLSVQQAFPKLAQLEATYGSLIRGQILGGRDRKKRGEVAKDRAPKFSFDEGLQVLPDGLGKSLGGAVLLGAAVSRLTKTSAGWRVEYSGRSGTAQAEHQAVVYCGTAFQLAALTIDSPGIPNPAPLSEIRHPPVASLVLGFRREDVAHPCAGFGMLIPGIEKFRILGTIFSSSLFPNRAPAGHVTLTSYIGGERHPELAALPPDELSRITCEDLKVLLGVRGRPTFTHCFFHPKAIPQYNVGYGRYRDLMNDLESSTSGLYLAGHYRDGISLADSIVSGCKVAGRVAQALTPNDGNPPEFSKP